MQSPRQNDQKRLDPIKLDPVKMLMTIFAFLMMTYMFSLTAPSPRQNGQRGSLFKVVKFSNCSLKANLDNPGCNALPLSPRVQSGGGRCLRRCPGLTQLVWTEVIWSYVVNLMILWSGLYQAALNAELAEIRRIQTSMAQVGKLHYVGNSSLNPKKWCYRTNYQFVCV